MKILHILYELKYSGAEVMYVAAAPIFKELGCELAVINSAKKLGEYAPSFENAGFKVYHLPYPKGLLKRINYYRKLRLLIKREKYDVLHIHNSAMKWGGAVCAWSAGIKSVYTFHNVFKSNWYSYFYHIWLRWSAKYLFGCTFQTIGESVYWNEKKHYLNDTVKVYNWYNNLRFVPAIPGEREMFRKGLEISKDALTIISVGGCSPIKRHNEIVIAFTEILRKYPDAIYLHLGEGVSLEEEKALAKELNIKENIRFCGNQKDVRKYLISSDMYIMSSQHEGVPITTIECMGCKVPAILYDVPGLRDFNKEKECSLLIPEDSHILAQSVMELYENKEKQTELTNNAKQFVDTYFNMEKNVKEIFELYQQSK